MTITTILRETCQQYRKGSALIVNGRPATVEHQEALAEAGKTGEAPKIPAGENGVLTIEVFAMPKVEDAPANVYLVDTHFAVVGVDKEKAEQHRQEIVDWAKAHIDHEMSYIELGGIIGDQGMALCFMALGPALGLWQVLTPATFGIDGKLADEMAGIGYVMITTLEVQHA